MVIRSDWHERVRRARKVEPTMNLRIFRDFLGIFGLVLLAITGSGCQAMRDASPPTERAVAQAGAGVTAVGDTRSAQAVKPERKVVRQAELELEVASPSSAQTQIEQISEHHGGYVVSASRDTDHENAVDIRVNLVVRVPQAELTSALAEVKRLGRGTGSERITSDDVTDEYIDLSARISGQEKLEQQYLEILKHAESVKDALEVQKQLSEVRTEIERLRGRAQLIEKETTYSTLTVHLSPAVPQVAVSRVTIGGTFRRAWIDALAFSADLLEGGIRLAAFAIPILLLLGLPSAIGTWALVRLGQQLAARTRGPAPGQQRPS